jgi:hypothetical protein
MTIDIHKQLSLPSVELGKSHVDLHPDNLSLYTEDLVEVFGDEVQYTASSNAYAKAYEALAVIYNWHVDIDKAEYVFKRLGTAKAQATGQRLQEYLVGQKTKTMHGGEKDVYAAAGESMTTALKRVQIQSKEVEKFRETVVKSIGTAMDAPELKSPFGIAVAQSIWQHMNSMKGSPDQKGEIVSAASLRGEFIMDRIENGDRLTVMSILNAPPYLSGIKPDQAKVYRAQAANTWAPKESRHLRAVDKIIEKIDLGAGSVLLRYTELSKTVGKVSTYEKEASVALQQLKSRPVNWGKAEGPLASPNGGK